MNITKQVQDGERIPRGYRIAYIDFLSRRAYAYPIGIHWLVRWAVRFHRWTYMYNPDKLERLLMEHESRIRTEIAQKERRKPTTRREPLRWGQLVKLLNKFGWKEMPSANNLTQQASETSNHGATNTKSKKTNQTARPRNASQNAANSGKG